MNRVASFLAAVRVFPARARGLAASGRSLRAAERTVGPIDVAFADLQSRFAATTNRLDGELAELRAASHVQAGSDARDGLAGRDALVAALWAANAPISLHPLVSVVLPTFLEAREGLLRGAIDSVLAQTYRNWELLVIDNSAEGLWAAPPQWWPDDERIRVLRSTPNNASIARNVGLDHARGDLVAYLDDDCTWFPWWLRAAVASFEGNPDAQFAHGILLAGTCGAAPLFVTSLQLTPLQLHLDNPIDTNHLVHRAGLGERWDPAESSCSDYHMVQRLAIHPHVFVPVPACAYGTEAPERAWAPDNDVTNAADRNEMRRLARKRRPMRIVAANALYPLITETYIGDELEGLRRCDVDIVLARSQIGPTPCPSAIDVPIYEQLEDAIAHHDPDLVLSHWAETANWAAPTAAAFGVPHAIRLHSFCASTADSLIFTPWCVGAWGFPGITRPHPRAHDLPTLILDPSVNTEGSDAGRGRTLLTVSAGLPKKAWPELVQAAGLVDDAQLQIIIGRTNGWEHLPDEVRQLCLRHGLPYTMRVDLPYAAAQQAIREAGALVYTLGPDVPVGQPRSVLEAALATTPLVLPDHPSLRSLVDDIATFYTRGNPVSLRNAMETALGRPHSFDERLALAERVRARHAHPKLWEGWADELTQATVRWQNARDTSATATAARFWSGA